MSYSARAILCAPGSDFVGRVTTSCLDYALFVDGEDPSTANHATRQAFADLILADVGHGLSLQMAFLVSGDGTNDGSDDPTIVARVASLWDHVASLATSQTLASGTEGSGSGS